MHSRLVPRTCKCNDHLKCLDDAHLDCGDCCAHRDEQEEEALEDARVSGQGSPVMILSSAGDNAESANWAVAALVKWSSYRGMSPRKSSGNPAVP